MRSISDSEDGAGTNHHDRLKTSRIPDQYKMISVQELPDLPGREYTMIDFISAGHAWVFPF